MILSFYKLPISPTHSISRPSGPPPSHDQTPPQGSTDSRRLPTHIRCPRDQRSYRQTALWVGPLSLPRVWLPCPPPQAQFPVSSTWMPCQTLSTSFTSPNHREAPLRRKQGQPRMLARPRLRGVLAECPAFARLLSLWAVPQSPLLPGCSSVHTESP